MRFAEPHAEGARPCTTATWLIFLRSSTAIRYVRSQFRLRYAVFVKAGNLIIGPGWVLFTVMDRTSLPSAGRARSGRGAFLGMSILLGARESGDCWDPLLTARVAGTGVRRLEIAIFWDTWAPRQRATRTRSVESLWQASLCVMLAPLRQRDVWVFLRRSCELQSEDKIPRPGVRRRSRTCHVNDCRGAYLRAFVDMGVRQRGSSPAWLDVMLIPAGLWGWRFATRKGSRLRVSVFKIPAASIFAARMKSDSVNPVAAASPFVISTLPPTQQMSDVSLFLQPALPTLLTNTRPI